MATNGPSEKSQGEPRKTFLLRQVTTVALIIIGLILAGALATSVALFSISPLAQLIALVAVTALLIATGFQAYDSILQARKRQERIGEIEREVVAHPEKTKPAWDLASAKLEDYLARNLSQVRSIYYLVIMIMLIGFVFIGYGVYFVYSGVRLEASIVAAVSGIIIQFIAGTFLLIYRSIMEQAKDYVAMLERINAVGMSVQLVESIEDPDPKVRDEVRADLASSLLEMYGKSPKA